MVKVDHFIPGVLVFWHINPSFPHDDTSFLLPVLFLPLNLLFDLVLYLL